MRDRHKRLVYVFIVVAVLTASVIGVVLRFPSRTDDRRNYFRICVNDLLAEPMVPHRAIYSAADGKNLYSWRYRQHILRTQRTDILDDVQARLARSWLSEENKSLREADGPILYCYADKNTTCVLAVTGTGTVFDSATFPNWLALNPHLIVLVESASSEFHWMEPGDFDVTRVSELAVTLSDVGISSESGEEIHVAFADGEVWRLSMTTPFDSLRKFMTVSAIGDASREVVLGPYRVR